jgi:hypothetical protein
MATYHFLRWEDETGAVIGTSPTLTYTITSDKTFRAVYEVVTRKVTYQSSPIAVTATIDTTSIASGTTIQVEDGATITITVPSEVSV